MESNKNTLIDPPWTEAQVRQWVQRCEWDKSSHENISDAIVGIANTIAEISAFSKRYAKR